MSLTVMSTSTSAACTTIPFLLRLAAIVLLFSSATQVPAEPQAAEEFTPDRCNQIRSSLPPPPKVAAAAVPVTDYRTLKIVNSRLDLGIGHLYPKRAGGYKNWQLATTLPLFSEPGDTPFAWIHKGWITNAASGKSVPFNAEGMIAIAPLSPAFIVYQLRKDGWMRIRYSREREGIAWTHRCLTSFGRPALAFQSWADYLRSKKGPLFFRSRVRHALRTEPSITSNRILWIPAYQENYHFRIISIKDDWMQIRLSVPSNRCKSRKHLDVKHYEGWVKWRDQETGPWVWHPVRDC